MSILAAVIIPAASSMPSTGEAAHADEIKAFASTMAITKTVKESRPGIEPDDRYIEVFRQRPRVMPTSSRSCRKLEWLPTSF